MEEKTYQIVGHDLAEIHVALAEVVDVDEMVTVREGFLVGAMAWLKGHPDPNVRDYLLALIQAVLDGSDH